MKRWAYTDKLEGLLFFAQVVEESLFDYTVDTFRPPTLNSFYRCSELSHALGEVRRATLHAATLVPMAEELALSLTQDSVARSLLEPHREALVHALRENTTKTAELETLVRFVHARLRHDYRRSLESRIEELVVEGHEKSQLAEVTRSWITHLTNEGFSPGGIFYSVTQRFFSEAGPKITDCSEVNAFLKTFEMTSSDWEVVFKVSPRFKALEAVGKDISIALSDVAPPSRSAHNVEKLFLESNPQGLLFATVSKVKARDAAAARDSAEGHLRTVANVGYLHAHRDDFAWEPDALVYDNTTSRVIRLDQPTPHVHKRPDCPESMLGNIAEETNEIFQRSSFEMTSTIRLLQVLDLHAAAVKAPTLANQLLNFWAAIETLLPPPTAARIVHIVRTASPLLCRAYPVKLIRYLLDAVRGNLGGKGDAVLSRVPHGKNQFERMAAVVALKKNEKFRDQLYALCNPNPLLRYRISWAFENLSTAPSIRETIDAHKRRVEWHVYRIYRSRNLILHAGEILPYLGSLIENVHSYLDRMLDLVRHALQTRPYLRTLDSALLEVDLDHSAHMDALVRAGKSECTPETFIELLFGPRPTAAVESEAES